MNKYSLALLIGLFSVLFVGCSDQKKISYTASADSAKEQKNEPIALGNGREVVYDTRVSGHNYHISICCVADKQGAVFTDELGQKFYPNRVNVVILKDGKDLLRHTFVKEDFAAHLTQETATKTLQGMNFYEEKSDASYLCLTCLIGEPGIDGGAAFLVKVSTENGSFAISPDLEVLQENNMEEGT